MVNFESVSLKCKTRTNTLDLEGRKRAWSNNTYSGLKLCNRDIESTDHLLFQCKSLSSFRDKYFSNLKEELLYMGYQSFWDDFENGTTEFKHHILLDDLYSAFPFERLGGIVDRHCKQYPDCYLES